MNKDRSDLLDMSIGLIELKYGNKQQRDYNELYALLDQEFPKMRFSLDEIVEYYALSLEMEDRLITFKNATNDR
jgi:hypothetical protein